MALASLLYARNCIVWEVEPWTLSSFLMCQIIITSFQTDFLDFDCLTWRNKQDVSSLFLHGDILRDNHSMFENPTHSLMSLQAQVQIHVVWHLKWTRLVDYQTLFSDDKHVDLCGVIYAISWMVWVLMDTELCQHITHLYPLHYQGQTEPSSDKNRN